MNRTEYKNNFGREHYERINLVVPKGMKDIIKALASSKGMSVNAVHARPCQKRPMRFI